MNSQDSPRINDILSIDSLTVDALIGIHAWEQQLKQKLIISVDMAINAKLLAKSQDLTLGIDYSEVAKHIEEYALSKPFNLLECFAEELASYLLEHTRTPWLRLTIRKPAAIRNANCARITIERPTNH